MNLLRTLLSRFYWWELLTVAIGLLVALVLLWQFCTYSPDNPAALSRARRRQINQAITASQRALALDTPRAIAAEVAGRVHLDTAKAHAHRAVIYHQKTAVKHSPHAKKTTPPAAAGPAAQLQRQLANYAAGH